MIIPSIKARHAPARFFRGMPQYIQLKQLADLEAGFRAECRGALRHYRENRRKADGIEDPLERHYCDLKTDLARRRAEDAVRLYALLRRDTRRSIGRYITATLKKKF